MVKLALVGFGRWGKNYLKTIEKISNCKLLYISSPSIEKQNLPKKYIKVKNYKELLKKDIDGVIIATPASTHYKISSDFIKHNKNLLIEKPIVVSTKELSSLKKIIKKSKSIIFPGHIYLYNKGIIQTKKLIKKIGTVKKIEYVNFSKRPINDSINDLWDRAYHDIYLSSYFLDELPLRVFLKVDETTKATLLYKKDITVFINVSSRIRNKKRLIKVSGDKGELIFDDVNKTLKMFVENGNPIIKQKVTGEPLEDEILEFIRFIKNHKNVKLRLAFDTIEIISKLEKNEI